MVICERAILIGTGRVPAIALILSMTMTVAGCIPRTAPVTPGIEAKVVDATTHLPIEAVLVTAWADTDPSKTSSARTNADGIVHVPALERTIWMPPLPYEFANPQGHARFDAAGYETQELDAQVVWRRYFVDHEPVELSRKTASVH